MSPDPAGRPGPRAPWARGTLALRLTLGYAALFALSAVALFALTYALLLGVMRGQDRAYAGGQLRAYAAAYARGGVPAVERAARTVREDDRGEELLVRVSDAGNRTALLFLPEDWRPDDVARLGRERPQAGGRVVLRSMREDEEVEVVAVLFADGATIQVGMSSDERNDVAESFPSTFLGITLPLLALAFFGGAFMAQRAVRPVRQLVGTLRSIIETGDVRERAPAPAVRGEMAELFRLFNEMLGRIEGLVGRLRGTLDDVAHDLRTPMTRLRGTAELALGGGDPAALREALADAVEASSAVLATLDTIMDVAEAESGALALSLEPVDLGRLVRDVAELYGPVADEKGVVLDVEADDGVEVTADRRRLGRALANLVDNAVKYTPPGGRVVVRAGRTEGGPTVSVADTGPGIPETDLPWIWDRHFRGDQSRATRGLGLGLSLARALVEAHGGRVEVESRPGQGAVFTVHLPATAG
ncbi:MAG TPA: HAMP domain-containing sensor histidine kinase [Rubricoccaceae bacterium]